MENWDYADHGQSWYELGKCGEGVGQSPINITQAKPLSNEGNFLYYRLDEYTAPIKMYNTEHGMEAALEVDAGVIAVGTMFPSRITEEYSLVSLDFHSPSEHTYKGVRVPLEMQLKFKGKEDAELSEQTAIVAIGFYSSFQSSSHTLESLRQGGLPPLPGDNSMVNGQQPASINFHELFGPSGAAEAGFWSYDGSLTAPPCTTGVKWFVRDDALPANPDHLEEFKAAVIAGAEMSQDTPGNAREIQGGMNREVMWLASVDALQLGGLAQANSTFDEAAQEAAAAQKEADAALHSAGEAAEEAAELGANGTTTSGPPTTSALSPSSPYQVCLQNLDRIYLELKAAENQRLLECQGQVQAQHTFDEAGEGTKPQAAKILNGQKTMCSDATVVATSLEAQAANQKAECDTLAPDDAAIR